MQCPSIFQFLFHFHRFVCFSGIAFEAPSSGLKYVERRMNHFKQAQEDEKREKESRGKPTATG